MAEDESARNTNGRVDSESADSLARQPLPPGLEPLPSHKGTSQRAANEKSTGQPTSWPPAWLPPCAIVLVALLWPFIAYGATRAWQSSQNRIEDWLPASLPETQNLYSFFDRFGSDEFLMISWPGCQLDDERAERLEQLLLKPSSDGKRYFDQAQSGSKLLTSLVDNQRLTPAEARARMTGLFIGPDGKQTCVIGLVSPSGFDDRKAAVQHAWDATRQATGLSIDDIHIAGTTADSSAVDEASNAYLSELNAGSWLVCLTIMLLSLRNLWLVGTLFLTAIFNQQLALAFIYYSGGHVDSVQMLVANLSLVLSISAGLHYLGYFREALQHGAASPALAAVRQAFWPSFLAALTTSLGFASLCTSVLVPIRSFGFYSAILVPINTVIVVSLLAIHASWATRRNWRWQLIDRAANVHRPSGSTAPGAPTIRGASSIDRTPAQSPGVWTRWIVPGLKRAPLTIVVLWLCLIATTGWGVSRLSTSVGTHKLLSPDAKLVRDYAWLEEHVGALVPIELVMRFQRTSSPSAATSQAVPADEIADSQSTSSARDSTSVSASVSASTFRRLLAIDRLRRRFDAVPQIESTLSVINFLPRLPEGGGIRDTARRAVIGKLAHESHERFQQMRLLYSDDHEECWRISGRIAGAVTTDYEKLLADVQAMVSEYQTEYQTGREPASLSELTIDISGGVPFLYRTQRQLLADLLASFSTAFLMIAASMALLFRSISGGLLTMLPNVTPAAIVFGLMGWFGLEVEIGTVLTASVMMGVCVDDTLHLISHFRAFRAQGWTQSEAVNEALNNCGGAMIQTGLVCGLGMLIFAFSPFVPVARFAWLTFALLMVGVASDILLTPAMLLSPLHHLFYWKSLKSALATDTSSPAITTPALTTPAFTAPTPTTPTSLSTPEPVALPEAES